MNEAEHVICWYYFLLEWTHFIVSTQSYDKIPYRFKEITPGRVKLNTHISGIYQ